MSSSEAVNAWYALSLWGDVTGRPKLRDLGRLMTATELRSVHRYWQITGDGIYGQPYAAHKIVGVLWGTKVDHATFFGANLEYIHAIQMLPFTPITEALLDPAWVSEEYPVLATVLDHPDLDDSWRGFVVMDHA